MKIGIAQLNGTDDIQNNFNQIKKIVLEAQSEKPKVIIFPENSLYMRIDSKLGVEALSLDHEIFNELKEICEMTQIDIHLTTAIKENSKIYNASIFIDKHKRASVVYRKIHLFDIELLDQNPIRESDVFSSGEKPSIFNIEDFRVGSSICYDIRFAELYSRYAADEVDVIIVPAAFLVKTGRAHWETLLRSRAIESQCYVIAPAQAGIHKSVKSDEVRETYGHSMIINPWGEVIAQKKDGVGILFAELSHQEIESVRKQIPMRNHRRIDF